MLVFNQIIVFVLSAALLLFVTYRFIRALKHRKVTDGASIHAWSVFFLVCLIALLTVDAIGKRLDGYFVGLPVTTLIRSLLMLTTVVVFFRGIDGDDIQRPRAAKYLIRFTVVAGGLSISAFIWFAVSGAASSDTINYFTKNLRDAVMIVWVLLIFIPFSVRLWRNEQVRPMKLHRAIDLGFWFAFLIISVTGIALSLVTTFAERWQPYLWAIDRSFTYLCYLLMLMTLFPYRWLMPLFYPRKLLLYLRLKRLQHSVKRWSATQPPQPNLSLNLAHPDELELAIYQTVIHILDMYPSMSGNGRALQDQIQRVVDTQPTYNEVAQKLANLRS